MITFLNKSLLAIAITATGTANAALYDRGNGMIYDNVLDVTWLQDFNYAKTHGYDDQSSTYFHLCGHSGPPACNWEGNMWQLWNDAGNWAASLTVGGVSGWRLPSANLIGNTTPSTDGSTDTGTNNIRSELGHLFYADLGNSAGSSITNTTFIDAATGTTKSFFNVKNYIYWLEGTGSANNKGWYFDMGSGYQGETYLDNSYIFAVAVHDGDIAVPLPGSAWLFISSLIMPVFLRRKSNGEESQPLGVGAL